MSQLERPRIHFAGTFETNVGTANNDDTARPPVVDVANVTVDPRGMTDDEFRKWMEGTTTADEGESPGEVRSGWNYYGDNSCRFKDVVVTSVELADGSTLSTAGSDALVGAAVGLGRAVMVDLDPTGYANTQIVADRFDVVAAGGARLRAADPARAYSRWISFRRNLGVQGFTGASAVFQTSAAMTDLEWKVDGSPALAAVSAALQGTAGLTMRFCLYLMSPGLSNDELAAKFAAGERVSNPAVGRVIGTIGPWLEGEPTSVAMGRLLVPSASTIIQKVPVRLGSAVARVDQDRKVVCVDLVNTFPEADASRRKEGFGVATLRVDDGTKVSDIGPVPYDQAAYEATAGMVEVAFDPALAAALADGALVLGVENGGDLLREAPLMVDSDDRCVYLQQGSSTDVHLLAAARGGRPASTTELFVSQEPSDPAHNVVEVPDRVEVGGEGQSSVSVRGAVPGVTILRFSPVQNPGRFDASRESFVSVRVLPTDDFSHVSHDDLTFALVYEKVLRYYHLLHPAMSEVLDISDEQIVGDPGVAQTLVERTDPGLWARFAYMPRTRELSEGKRQLLVRWHDKVQGS